ncbi:TPA: glycosyltransferase family 1 protein [Candidatus Bathyarchaeota archaeon]|nr:glycosyltransferase family 1 protein [Candidatus Bathyarchaeota archaeon]HIJ08932.1 glycosyltransferase family 1 protein [Candidatus Bathyarchaeota archaeon]
MSVQQNSPPTIPKRIERLHELSNNLWWSWDEDGRQVFRSLDYELWRNSGQNPVKQLAEISRDRIEAAAADPAFLELYDSAIAKFDSYMLSKGTWCDQRHPEKFEGKIAYFSAEYAIHNSLPIYAGGLGVLAGDICKEASDIGLPLVSMGFMYPQGYFKQRISAQGEQQEVYTQLDFGEAPISPCAWPEACGPLVPVQLAERQLYVQVWLVHIGRVDLYLLDTNVPENKPEDRTLSARLYTADPEERISQLITLGIGGVRALRELRINPTVWHANEDHTAFMILERLREERKKGLPLDSAIENVRRSTIFTTHTPVQAGHHIFPHSLMDRYLHSFWESANIDRDIFLKLGQYEGMEPDKFSLTAFALRLSIQSNAVSRLHGGVARKMWQMIWPSQEENPISYITNGVHLPSWQAPEIADLCEKQMGKDWRQRQTESEFWNCVVSIPDEQFWELRQKMKNRLLLAIQDRAQKRWMENSVTTQQVLAMGSLLDPYALTIAFSRRFTEYKRPYLILSNPERLKKIVTNPLRPVQIIFAGKSHPADYQSKQLLKHVYQLAMDRGFQGRIAFLEDYDMLLARELVRGADVWLNNPRRLQEACGTSGMKASMNGVINLSVRDGWWDEAYNGYNGWAIDSFQGGSTAEEDKSDAESLYHLLENRIIPLYYTRDRKGIPHQWIKIAKEAIRTISPTYNACRMMREYTERMYKPAADASRSNN